MQEPQTISNTAVYQPRVYKRYLFCTLAGAGYVYPAIEIAKCLIKRGHEVAFITGSQFATDIEASGAHYISPVEGTFKHFHVPYWGYVSGVVQQVQYTQYALKQWGADCVLTSSLALGPMIAARDADLPLAVLGLGTYTWPTDQCLDRPCRVEYLELANRRLAECKDIYGKACSEMGIESPSFSDSSDNPLPLLGDTFLLQSVPTLESRPLPRNVTMIGSCLPKTRPLDPHNQSILKQIDGRDFVYIQHDARWVSSFLQNGQQENGVPDFLPLMSQIADTQLLVVSTNDKHLASTCKHPNIIVGTHLDHSVFVPASNLVVGVGTSSLLLTAMSSAKPIFIITTASESFDVASVCERAGVGLVCSATDITEQKLRDGIDELRQRNTAKKRLETVQKDFAERDSSKLAADALEALIPSENNH